MIIGNIIVILLNLFVLIIVFNCVINIFLCLGFKYKWIVWYLRNGFIFLGNLKYCKVLLLLMLSVLIIIFLFCIVFVIVL